VQQHYVSISTDHYNLIQGKNFDSILQLDKTNACLYTQIILRYN